MSPRSLPRALLLLLLTVPVVAAGPEDVDAPVVVPAGGAFTGPVVPIVSAAPASALGSRAAGQVPALNSESVYIPGAVAGGAPGQAPQAGLHSEAPGVPAALQSFSADELNQLSDPASAASSEQLRSEAARPFEASSSAGAPEDAPRVPPPAAASAASRETSNHLPIAAREQSHGVHDPTLYSASRLGEFAWNQEDYVKHWVFGVKKAEPKALETFMGDIAHQSMKQLNTWLTNGKRAQDISIQDVLDVYNTLWDEQYEEGKYKVKEDMTPADTRRRGEEFLKDQWSQFYPFDQGQILMFERKLFYTIPDPETGSEIRMQGTPDLVLLLHRPDGKTVIRIVDYKTTLHRKTAEDLRENDFQLSYVEAIRQNFPKLAEGADFEFEWRYMGRPEGFPVTPELERQVKERIAHRVHEIRAAEAQAEANRAEWERRQHPSAPVEDMKEASGLVDRWSALSDEKAELRGKLKALEDEEEGIIERLLAFAKKTGNTTIPGKDKDAVLKETLTAKTPTKTGEPENYEALARAIKQAGLWEQFSALDLSAVKEMAKLEGHPHHALYEKIKQLVAVTTQQDMKLKDKETPGPKGRKKKD